MKFLKYILWFAISLIVLSTAIYLVIDEPLPSGVSGSEADALAEKMLESVSNDKWLDTEVIQWEFAARSKRHKHIWDKKRHFAEVEFNGTVVQIDIHNRKGIVLSSVDTLSEIDKTAMCERAWQYWINDSFWLNPVSKVFDPGTDRLIVEGEDGSKRLLVTYSSGGVTPGDSYLWILNEEYRPVAWKFWVSIIPIGGLQFTWENWQELISGALISTYHDGIVGIRIDNPSSMNSPPKTAQGQDIFAPLKNASINF
ncbi:MAG: hypothetical protein JXQ96_11775 [Cyclobacteriaceae bacterium]